MIGLHLKQPPSLAEQYLTSVRAERNNKAEVKGVRLRRRDEIDRTIADIDIKIANIKRNREGFPTDDEDRELRRRGAELTEKRAELVREREKIQAEIDALPDLAPLDETIEYAEWGVHGEDLYTLASDFNRYVPPAIRAITILYEKTEELARLYPNHRFLPATGKHIPAHGGAPPIPRALVRQLCELTQGLCERLAEWKPSLFDANDPARRRAEHIAAVEQHGADASTEAIRRQQQLRRSVEARRAVAVPTAQLLPQPVRDAFSVADENNKAAAKRNAATK